MASIADFQGLIDWCTQPPARHGIPVVGAVLYYEAFPGGQWQGELLYQPRRSRLFQGDFYGVLSGYQGTPGSAIIVLDLGEGQVLAGLQGPRIGSEFSEDVPVGITEPPATPPQVSVAIGEPAGDYFFLGMWPTYKVGG